MGILNYTRRAFIGNGLPEVGSDLGTSLDEIRASVNSVDATQVSNSFSQVLGVNNGSKAGRGKSIISATESTSSATAALLTTPDQVTVDLPTDGLIHVAYVCRWKESALNSAIAGIFLNGPTYPLSAITATSPYYTAGYATGLFAAPNAHGLADVWRAMGTHGAGLVSVNSDDVDASSDVVFGQAVGVHPAVAGKGSGGVVSLFMGAGPVTVSVRFWTSSGTVSVKERKLWVWTTGF